MQSGLAVPDHPGDNFTQGLVRRAPEDGRWELRLPCVDPTELVMDLPLQGEQVEMIEPASLREAVRQRMALAAGLYGIEA